MLKKILFIATALFFVTAGTAAAQDADPYADEETIVASDTTVAPGGSTTVTLTGCVPGSTATFTWDDGTVLGTATANDQGSASATVTVPSNATPGSHTITGTCPGADGNLVTEVLGVTVTRPGGATGAGNLPTTGSSSTTPMTQVAIATIAAGGLLVLLANKRRSGTKVRETAGV